MRNTQDISKNKDINLRHLNSQTIKEDTNHKVFDNPAYAKNASGPMPGKPLFSSNNMLTLMQYSDNKTVKIETDDDASKVSATNNEDTVTINIEKALKKRAQTTLESQDINLSKDIDNQGQKSEKSGIALEKSLAAIQDRGDTGFKPLSL